MIPGGGFCAGKPCWKESSSGFKYSDKGTLLDMPALDELTAPLTVQLTAATGQCWEAVHGAFLVQTPEQLKAKAD